MKCTKHPKYMGIYPPKVDCAACERVYFTRRLEDMESRLRLLEGNMEATENRLHLMESYSLPVR